MFGKYGILKLSKRSVKFNYFYQFMMKVLYWIALVLVVIGGLNWGLVGLFGYDLVAAVFGDMTTITKVIYDLVGLAAIYMIFSASKCCKGDK